ncbi:MAG: hypothetical protein ACE366_18040 [Bradymonadia bacterium]
MHPSEPSHSEAPAPVTFRAMISDALRYWEIRRIPFTIILAVVAIVRLWPLKQMIDESGTWPDVLLELFILGIMANICYCVAYIIDLLVQGSDFREGWRRQRWLLWVLGLGVGMALAWMFAPLALFSLSMGVF